MKRKCKVIPLPTKDRTQIIYRTQGANQGTPHNRKYYGDAMLDMGDYYAHLYICSDDEIKERDWFISGNDDEVKQFQSGSISTESKKIIATTDKSLTVDGTIKVGDFVNSNKQDFNLQVVGTERQAELYNESDHYFKCLPQLSKAFIESYCKNPVDEVMVEWLRSSAGWYDENDEWHWKPLAPKVIPDNEIVIRPAKDSWTREEMEKEVIDFSVAYSGMAREKVIRMYNKWKERGTL